MKYGSEIRAGRRRLGLTQAELGEKLGYDRFTISRKERDDLPVHERDRMAMQALLSAAMPRAEEGA